MKIEKVVKFECGECGSNELGYQKYVKCLTPVTITEGGQMEYGRSEVYEDDYLYADNCFICMNCKGTVEHCGYRFEIETDLIEYLSMDPDARTKEQQDYNNQILDEIDKACDEQESTDEDLSAFLDNG